MYRLDDVSRAYVRDGNELIALQVPSLKIGDGEYLAVVGASGSGKTTLLSILGGMLTPSTGQVWLGSDSLYDLSVVQRAEQRRSRIGFLFQAFHLVPYLTALENVQVPMALSGITASKQRERATALLERVGLTDRMHHKPASLSMGQQQRVALARMLANEPRVILADEPTGNLDPANRDRVLDFFDALNREGRTIVMVTHDSTAAQRSHRTLVLRDGIARYSPPLCSQAA